MLAVEWADLSHLGAFLVGAAFGVLVTMRLAKVLAAFFGDLRRRDAAEEAPRSPRRPADERRPPDTTPDP